MYNFWGAVHSPTLDRRISVDQLLLTETGIPQEWRKEDAA